METQGKKSRKATRTSKLQGRQILLAHNSGPMREFSQGGCSHFGDGERRILPRCQETPASKQKPLHLGRREKRGFSAHGHVQACGTAWNVREARAGNRLPLSACRVYRLAFLLLHKNPSWAPKSLHLPSALKAAPHRTQPSTATVGMLAQHRTLVLCKVDTPCRCPLCSPAYCLFPQVQHQLHTEPAPPDRSKTVPATG